jgi:hypothetical protein
MLKLARWCELTANAEISAPQGAMDCPVIGLINRKLNMNVNDLYPLWIANGRDDLSEHVDRQRAAYEKLAHKDSVYGRSIKAIIDLRVQMLAVWDAAPKTLPDNVM